MATKKDFPHPFTKIAAAYRKMREKLPAEVSNIALKEFKENFRRQGYRNNNGMTIPWKSTKKKQNVLGSKNKGILSKSGRLKRSLRAKPDYNTARVVTDVPYAQIQNEGGKIVGTQNVKAHTRKNKKSKKKPVSKVKAHKRKVNTTIPRRPFMITTKPLLNDIDKHIDNRLGEIWDKA